MGAKNPTAKMPVAASPSRMTAQYRRWDRREASRPMDAIDRTAITLTDAYAYLIRGSSQT